MPRTRTYLAAVAVLILTLSPQAEAAWFYAAHSAFQPRGEAESHPQAITQLLVMPHGAVRPLVCIAYNNSAGAAGQGRIVSTIRVTTPGGEDLFGLPIEPTVRVMHLSGGVSRNSYLNCRVAQDMKKGDIVEFEHDFRGMPRLKSAGDGLDFAEINGIVSDAGKPTVWNAPHGFRLPEGNSPRGLVAPAKGGWYHSTNLVFQAEKDGQKQPRKVVQTLVLPAAAKRPSVCAGYSNRSSNKSKGRLLTTVRIDRLDGSSQTLKLSAGVQDNTALSCKQTGDLLPGDMVRFSFLLRGMPRLTRSGQTIGFADLTGAISAVGEPAFREDSPPPPPPPPNPNPPPPPGEPVPAPSPSPPPSNPSPSPPPSNPSPPPSPPGGGGSISSSDAVAAAKLLYANRGTQLWRPKGNNPTRWLVVGPKTRAVPGTNQLILSTAGVGHTIASAVADYERKMGSLGSGGALSSSDRTALQWYAGIDASGGPTSIRRDGRGGYHGEFYRRWSGAVHAGPFSSIKGAVDWMRSRGL